MYFTALCAGSCRLVERLASGTAATLLVRSTRAERESRRWRGGGGGPRSSYRGCVEVVRRRRRERRERGASTRHKGRGLIHRWARTRLHAVVERISFIAILDERDQPVTRLPRESQGRESTEFPLPRPRGTRDNRESKSFAGTARVQYAFRRIGALVTEKRGVVVGRVSWSFRLLHHEGSFAKIWGYRDDTNSMYCQLTTVPYEIDYGKRGDCWT